MSETRACGDGKRKGLWEGKVQLYEEDCSTLQKKIYRCLT